ncbi:hypothetical protein K8I28_00825 [bacterium]|nr:hypothetical protein [bacterium]
MAQSLAYTISRSNGVALISNLIGVVILSLCFTRSVAAVDLQEDVPQPPDTYERIAVLVDSLRSWSIEVLDDQPQLDSADDMSLDSTILAEWFPGSRVTLPDSVNQAIITYPKYLDSFSSTLIFTKQANILTSQTHPWSLPLTISDHTILLDSVSFPIPETVKWDSSLTSMLENRLLTFRTIDLPENQRVELEGEVTDTFEVVIRGRDTVRIPFQISTWLHALRELSRGMQVYAGLLSVSGDIDNVKLSYYLLITYPDAPGHHFIEWKETLTNRDEKWLTSEVNVIFTPYIRTDNLKNLFATPDTSAQNPYILKLR